MAIASLTVQALRKPIRIDASRIKRRCNRRLSPIYQLRPKKEDLEVTRQSKHEVLMYGLHAIQIVGGLIFLWYAAADKFRMVAWLGVVIGVAGLEIKRLAARDTRAFAIRERIEANGFKWMRWSLAIGVAILMVHQLALLP